MIDTILVVVPAHDEEQLLPSCLASVRRAAEHPSLAATPVRVAVVLDRCSDGSGEQAVPLLRGGDVIVERRDGNVGAARRAGARTLLAGEVGRPLTDIWLATTDADSRVPRDWLARQVRMADVGADAVAGTILIEDWREQPPATRNAFAARYARGVALGEHRHVHGANLGARASAYERVGGLAELPLAEDHALIDALSACGASIVRPHDLRVVTSARRESRAPGGFGDYLRVLV